jgi:hypothetical protein
MADDEDDIVVDLEHPDEVDWLARGRTDPDLPPAEKRRELNIAAEKPLLQGERGSGITAAERETIYRQFTAAVDLTAAELRAWGEHRCSDEASINPEKIRARVLELLTTDREDWSGAEFDDARILAEFVAGMREADPGDPPADGCPPERDVALLNWGHRPDGVDLDL